MKVLVDDAVNPEVIRTFNAAASHIFGFTIFNDFSARDTHGFEMQSGLGPSKSKDFDNANALGPCIVTADECWMTARKRASSSPAITWSMVGMSEPYSAAVKRFTRPKSRKVTRPPPWNR